AGPAELQGAVGRKSGVRVVDEAFLGDVELAAVTHIGALAEVGGGVLRGHWDIEPGLAGVLTALQLPGLLPGPELVHGLALQPPGREVGHGLRGEQIGERLDEIHGGAAAPQLDDTTQLLVAADDVGELSNGAADGPALPVEPDGALLELVEQPGAQGVVDLGLPGVL